VKILDSVVSVSTGIDTYHALAIKTDGSLWAWGDNINGQLGNGTTAINPVPVKIMDGVAAVAAGSGLYWACSMAIKTDGSLWAWGENSYGQLGDGTTTKRLTPVKIMDNVATASAGSFHSMAIKTDGSLWAWGDNSYGQLGDGTFTDRHTPVKIMDGVATVSVGREFSMAVKTDGSLWTWGNNKHLDENTTVISHTPVKIMDGVATVSAGREFSMAVKTDGSLWAWGWNNCGQLGDGTDVDKYTPTKIMDGITAISASSLHSMAIRADGSLWAWGANYSGQLGDGTDIDRFSPVKIITGISIDPLVYPSPQKPSRWAEADVTAAINAGLVPQALQINYTQSVTRAEFCALAVSLYEKVTDQEIAEHQTFTDTNDINVEKMAALGVVNGVGNNKFAPNNDLTREQAATMLSRLMSSLGNPLPKQAATFIDNSNISLWAIDAVGQIQAAGIMEGVGSGIFAPKFPYTREQSIITMLRVYNAVK
jgi:hypothetical protein